MKIYAALANRFRAWINEILRQLASPNLDSDSQESVFYRVETLYNTIVRFDGVHGIDDNIFNHLREVSDLLSSHSLSSSAHVAERLFTGQRGEPKYIFRQEQLEFLVERRFSVPQISKLLGVSPRTVERRLSEHRLSIRQTYTDMNDSDLDGLVKCILREFANASYKRMNGSYLLEEYDFSKVGYNLLCNESTPRAVS